MRKGEVFMHPENPRLEFRVGEVRLDKDGSPIVEAVPNASSPEEIRDLKEFQQQHLGGTQFSYFVGTQVAETVVNGVRTKICFHIPIGFDENIDPKDEGGLFRSPMFLTPFKLNYVH